MGDGCGVDAQMTGNRLGVFFFLVAELPDSVGERLGDCLASASGSTSQVLNRCERHAMGDEL